MVFQLPVDGDNDPNYTIVRNFLRKFFFRDACVLRSGVRKSTQLGPAKFLDLVFFQTEASHELSFDTYAWDFLLYRLAFYPVATAHLDPFALSWRSFLISCGLHMMLNGFYFPALSGLSNFASSTGHWKAVPTHSLLSVCMPSVPLHRSDDSTIDWKLEHSSPYPDLVALALVVWVYSFRGVPVLPSCFYLEQCLKTAQVVGTSMVPMKAVDLDFSTGSWGMLDIAWLWALFTYISFTRSAA